MIPQGFDVNFELISDIDISRTYKVSSNRIQGFADGLRALEQAIYKVLSTEKYEYPIYGFSYGIELESLIGKDPIYVKIELKRKIRECLLQDDRIATVSDFGFTVAGDEMFCTFDVVSVYGNITIQQEVSI